MNKLTIRQEKFCNYYLETGISAEAYRRAYNCEKWKEKSIWEKSSALLKNVKVQSRIDQLREEMRRRSDITKDEAVSILADIARANIVDALSVKTDNDSTTIVVKDVTKLPLGIQRAIISLKSTDKGYELRLYNKIDALDKLSKMLGWDEPTRQEISGISNIDCHRVVFEDYAKGKE